MLYGLYLSAQGAQTRATQLEVVANNIANAGTTSFKRDLALFQSHHTFDDPYGGSANAPSALSDSTGGVTIARTITDHSQGALQKTGGTFDLALAGPGYFRVSSGSEQFLTRDGRLTRNSTGELITADGGHRVLNAEGAAVRLSAEAAGIEVAQGGTLSERLATGEVAPIGRLAVVVPDPSDRLEKRGDSLYYAASGTSPADSSTRVVQGFLESSGVSPVVETMQMIEASRGFETNLNMMKFQDESLSRLLTAARP